MLVVLRAEGDRGPGLYRWQTRQQKPCIRIPSDSRFRRAGCIEGVFYAAETDETAVAEAVFHRLLFNYESPNIPRTRRLQASRILAVHPVSIQTIWRGPKSEGNRLGRTAPAWKTASERL